MKQNRNSSEIFEDIANFVAPCYSIFSRDSADVADADVFQNHIYEQKCKIKNIIHVVLSIFQKSFRLPNMKE